MRSSCISRSRAWSSLRSGEPGAYDLTGSFTGGGGLKIPWALMGAIVKSCSVRAELTRYSVSGWGDGELWTRDGVVLAHDFRFDVGAGAVEGRADESFTSDGTRRRAAGRSLRAAAPMGGAEPPSGTVPRHRAQDSDAFVADRRRCTVAEDVVSRIVAFLSGSPVAFADVELDLDPDTRFQRAVSNALRAVRRGEVVTYAELAALAGHPRAQRAVGTFCARNRFMFLLPCHRVVGSSGIGAYGSAGVAVKRRLLALEGTTL
jgi:O-6-methylguanine DNA methyltransferase